MMNIAIPVFLLAMGLVSHAQSSKTETLQMLEQTSRVQQEANLNATMTSSSRLFADKNDLTSVILIIPSGSKVSVLDSDSTYYRVFFEENEGFIFMRHAVMDKSPENPRQNIQQPEPVQKIQQDQPQQMNRFSYLENKYGSNMAARLIAGKIWKGMNVELVKDSWGSPEKINRVISGNIIKEEWIFKNTWLYFENNSLVEWGPIRR